MSAMQLMKVALLGVSVAALASGTSLAAAKSTHPAVVAPIGKLEPEALSALRRMSAYLNTLPRFQVSLLTERDDVDDEGELLTMAGETTFKVNKPDGFHISDTESTTTREFIYNGKQLTIADPKSGLYAQVPAPPTIRETLDVAADKYDIVVPLEDLFHWDSGDDESKRLTSARVVGPSKVNGQDADQYAFREAGVNWQIWIARGEKPVPLRVVIVASSDPARPQFEANLTWETAPQFPPETFVFTPAQGGHLISIASEPARTASQ